MRCPKCQYISFESAGRCRNCGYQLSPPAEPEDFDLPIRTGDEPVGPLADLELDREEGPPVAAPPEPPRVGARRAQSSGEFPLFKAVGDEPPLVLAPAPPRPPAAVRKPPVPAPRPSASQPEPEPALDLEAPAPARLPDPSRPGRSTPQRPQDVGAAAESAGVASAGARLTAAIVDLLLLASIDALVLYLTMRITGVEYGEIRVLPLIPFLSFLAILNGGYLIVFLVAGGQTIGKMLARIKVVNADEHASIDRVPLSQAVVRSAALLVSLLPAGLGFLPALLSADGRALHDRLANTRVVRA